jgi:hypothetical protein
MISRLAPPLVETLEELRGAAAHRDAAHRLRVIPDAMPPFSRTLADDAILVQLLLGDALPASTRAALDPRARALVERDGMRWAWWQRTGEGWLARSASRAGCDHRRRESTPRRSESPRTRR